MQNDRRTFPKLDALILFFLPIALLCVYDNWCYNHPHWLDCWLYLGHKRKLSLYVGDWFPGTYYASRITVLLIGSLWYKIFPDLLANYIDHLFWYYMTVYSFYYIVRSWAGRYEALTSALVLGCHGWFVSSIGWDYPDGAGIACQMLTFALLTKAVRSPYPFAFTFAAGIAAGAMVHAQIFLLFYCPAFLVYYVALKERTSSLFKVTTPFLLWFSAGFAILTALFGLFSLLIGGEFLFFMPSLRYGATLSSDQSPWLQDLTQWLPTAGYLFVPIFALILTSSYLVVSHWKKTTQKVCAVVSANFLMCVAILLYWHFKGQHVIQVYYYASFMMPTAFMAIAILLFCATKENSPSESAPLSLLSAGGLSCALALLWYLNCVFNGRLQFLLCPGPHMNSLWIALSFLAAGAVFALHFMRKPVGRLAGLLAFGAVAGVSGSHFFPTTVPTRESFLSTVRAQDWVAERSQDLKPLFWYENNVPLTGEFCGISSMYLWGFSLVNDTMPALKPGDLSRINFASRIVVMTDSMEMVKAAIQSLSKHGIQGTIKAQEKLKNGDRTILLAMLDLYPTRPLTPSKKASGEITLDLLSGDQISPHPLQSYVTQVNTETIKTVYAEDARTVRIGSTAAKGTEIAVFGPFVAPESGSYGFFMRYAYASGFMNVKIRNQAEKPIEISSDSQYARSGFINRIFMAPLQKGEVFYVVFESQSKYKPVELTLFDFWAWIS